MEQLADSIHAVSDAMNQAEAAMRQDKQAYYARNGQERQLRGLNEKLEQTLTEKRDAEQMCIRDRAWAAATAA